MFKVPSNLNHSEMNLRSMLASLDGKLQIFMMAS